MDTHYHGLTSAEVLHQQNLIGLNLIPEEKKSFFKKFLKWFFSPISLMLFAAAVLSFSVGKVVDFWVIMALYFVNFGIGVWHEHKADRAIESLRKHLLVMVWTLRDDTWKHITSVDLVPGDLVRLDVGAIVPADMKLEEAKNVTLNESALTGESLPQEKKVEEMVYSGSFLVAGRAIARVTATGAKTYFGKTVSLLEVTHKKSSLESDIIIISKFLGLVSFFAVIIISVSLLFRGAPFLEILTLDIGLIIAGIPIALPTVMSLILSVGVFELAKKGVVVRRLSSLEDLANVNLLLTDKTGTLTSSKIKVEKVVSFGGHTAEEIMAFAVSAIDDISHGSIEETVSNKAEELKVLPFPKIEFIVADSERKRATAIINNNNQEMAVSLGAPQIVQQLCACSSEALEAYTHQVAEAARLGYRALAVAVNKKGREEENMEIIGLLLLSDTIHASSKGVIEFMKKNGIGVKMMTGDNKEISTRIIQDLGIEGSVVSRSALTKEFLAGDMSSVACFSEILPADKYALVESFKSHHVVAVTGDGVNDIPAVKNADVGIAVSNAVDALKGAADIVLFAEGVEVIKDSIIEARKIFVRLYNYSLYRISESFRIIILMAVFALVFNQYALTPVELILLALLNDVPIISLAFDKVKVPEAPTKVNPRERLALSSLFGMAGIFNSLLILWIARSVLHFDWVQIQTLFFLKLVISGHMLVYVAHTSERWYKFLPSKQVLVATGATQLIATVIALGGFFIEPLPPAVVLFVWVWAFGWMQVSELLKMAQQHIMKKRQLAQSKVIIV